MVTMQMSSNIYLLGSHVYKCIVKFVPDCDANLDKFVLSRCERAAM